MLYLQHNLGYNLLLVITIKRVCRDKKHHCAVVWHCECDYCKLLELAVPSYHCEPESVNNIDSLILLNKDQQEDTINTKAIII